MIRSLVFAAMLAGCDYAFGLRGHPRDVPDAGPDAPAGHDEDHDGLIDPVDPCPADPGGGDADTDQVGDLCDPSDTTTEELVLFEPFVVASTTWVGNVPWRFESDSITNTSASLSESQISRTIAPVSYATVEATFNATLSTGARIGVGFNVAGIEIKCFLGVNGLGTPVLFVLDGQSYEGETAFAGKSPVHLSLTELPGHTFRCRGRNDGETPVDFAYGRVLGAAVERLSLHALATDVEVTSVVLWRTK